MDSDAHEIDVNITRVDLLMASLWAPLRMPALYPIFWLSIFAIEAYQHRATGKVWVTVVVAGIVATICAIGGMLYMAICTQMISTTRRGVLGSHRYRLTSEGFFESTAVNESLQRWTPELRAWRVPGYFLVRTPPLGVHVIPLRSFSQGAAAEQFWNTLQAHLRGGTPLGAPRR